MKNIQLILFLQICSFVLSGCFGGGKADSEIKALNASVGTISGTVKNLDARVADLEGGGIGEGGNAGAKLQALTDAQDQLKLDLQVLTDQVAQKDITISTLEARITNLEQNRAASSSSIAASPVPVPTAPALGSPLTTPTTTVVQTPVTPTPALRLPSPSAATTAPTLPVVTPSAVTPTPIPTSPSAPNSNPALDPMATPAAVGPVPTSASLSNLAAPDEALPDAYFNSLIVQHYRSQYPSDNRTNKEITLLLGQRYEQSGNINVLYSADPSFQVTYEKSKQP